MSNLIMIQRMCDLLEIAARVIREQAEVIAQHGIETCDGGMEAERTKLLAEMEEMME